MTEGFIIRDHRRGSSRKRKRHIFMLRQKGPKVIRLVFLIVSRTSSKARDVQGKFHAEHAVFQIHISVSFLGWQLFVFSVKERWGLGVKREIQGIACEIVGKKLMSNLQDTNGKRRASSTFREVTDYSGLPQQRP